MSKFDREEVLSLLGESFTEPLKFSELASELGVRKSQQPKLRRVLSALVNEGAVERVGRGTYALADANTGSQAAGRIRVHPAGYGFVEREDGLGDVFVPAKYRGAALDGDRVQLSTWEGYKGTEGRVDEILARGRAKLTGVLAGSRRSVYLEPDDPRIATDYGRVHLEGGAPVGRIGQCVVAEISRYPSDVNPELRARVTRVLGNPEDPNTEIEKILACEDIPVEFPEAGIAQATAVPQTLRNEDFADRIDLRDREFVTIDPKTARDFDDALCVEDGPHGGPRVWVAVADVSHYVHPDDPLDREAIVRGVSVYLPDRVIPMLPFELSSGICSLNPEVDRCAMVVRLDYSSDGHELVSTGFAAAVIRSRARLDYPGAAAALSGDFRGRRERYRQWAPAIKRLNEIARSLRKRRMERGAADLDIPEPRVVLDADDAALVRDIVRSKAEPGVKQAYSLVEEFMIAANEAVGAFLESRDGSAVWRIHAPPDEGRLDELAEVLDSFGIRVDVDAVKTPVGMRDLLEEISEKPAARSLSFLVLRSLKQAAYSIENVGHFGLASETYLHFTSPIRRYPDILVHRALKAQLKREGQAAGGAPGGDVPESGRLAELAATVSSHERRAMEVEREAVAMYRSYLMRDQLGEEFPGRVSAVTNFGIFVEIEEPFVEGLIKYDGLGDDHYQYDPVRLCVVGRKTGFTLGLGDSVRVEVIGASVARRQVDFRLVDAEPSSRGKKRARRQPAAEGRDSKRSRASKHERSRSADRRRSSDKKSAGKKSAGKKSASKKSSTRRQSSKKRRR